MWKNCELRFVADHPTAAGHFPSNPIIPGALLLDAVVRAIADVTAFERPIDIRVAKFLHLVRPGETIQIRWQSVAEGGIKFECRLIPKDTLAVAGILDLERDPP